MEHYVILSQGVYGDYSPTYFTGKIKITQEELNKKGIEIGDLLMKEYSENDNKGESPNYNNWYLIMKKWLK